MNRCLRACVIAAPLLATTLAAWAQGTVPSSGIQIPTATTGHRNFPSHAQLGVLRIQEIPNAYVNGQAIRTAPGFRLFNSDNKLIFAHSIYQQDLRVVFVKEASTNWLLTAWILSPEEMAALSAKR